MTRAQCIGIPELRNQDVSAADSHNKRTWYTETEEYKMWKHADTSVFLWFKGRSGTGKTPEISRILHCLDEDESDCIDKVAYFCPKTSSKPGVILRSLVIQLARGNRSRFNLLTDKQKSEMSSLTEPEYSTDIAVLWNLFRILIQPCLNRTVCLILDGIDVLYSEDLRKFATTLHSIFNDAKSKSNAGLVARTCCIRFLITSRPNVELAEIFSNEMMIDPDTEKSGLASIHAVQVFLEC